MFDLVGQVVQVHRVSNSSPVKHRSIHGDVVSKRTAEILRKPGQAVGTNVTIFAGFLATFEWHLEARVHHGCRTFSEEEMPMSSKQAKKPRNCCSPNSMKFFHAALVKIGANSTEKSCAVAVEVRFALANP